jgi:hypothetical protein
LTAQTCRWPIGDPGAEDFFFCGGETAAGLPYCVFHARIAYKLPIQHEIAWTGRARIVVDLLLQGADAAAA